MSLNNLLFFPYKGMDDLIGKLVVHKYRLMHKHKVISRVNDSQYVIKPIDDYGNLFGEEILCMRQYLLTIEDSRDLRIKEILNENTK